jgi:hypothetical protein
MPLGFVKKEISLASVFAYVARRAVNLADSFLHLNLRYQIRDDVPRVRPDRCNFVASFESNL